MTVSQKTIDALQPFLEGNAPTHTNKDGTREWNLRCPLHEDRTRSASLNIDKNVFFCNVCGGMPVTALLRRKSEWLLPEQHGHTHPNVNGKVQEHPQRVLTEGMIGGWHSALLSNGGALQWLAERRGLDMETITQYEIGMADNRLYTIPVRSDEGEIWNVRFYNPRPTGSTRKIWSERGYGTPPRLYPMPVMLSEPDEVIIGEGEWDVLLCLQHGFPAVTRTGPADHWNNEWGPWFKDRTVYVCQDRDEKGAAGNRLIATALQKVADVRIVELPYPLEPKHGKDLTDLLLEHGPERLRELLAGARPFGRRGVKRSAGDELATVTVLETFDARRVGEPVRVIVTVKGRKDPGYTIPHEVKLWCSRDAGNKCLLCPLNAAAGEATVNIESDDPLILHLIDSTNSTVGTIIADSYGVPGGKCIKLQQEVLSHQAVEILYARPALDYSDGTKAGEYKGIRITSVGRHDTPSNNTVSVIGALQPNPRNQSNEFLAHSLEILETSVDRFDLNDETIAMMRRFQGERPLHKLGEISRALSEHVTRIHGRNEMHALMDLTFHGVLSFKFAGELVNRGWLESLIVGDTRTGKSLAAERLIRHFGAGEIISCEAASFAGIVGGLQQIGGKEWIVTWGVVPLNDRRFVALDEVSGLEPEEIAQMSDIRSSGQARLVKIQQETTWARVRLLWLANPRNATMANFTYGVDAIRPLIGNAEDIARFDLAMALTKYDVPAETINHPAAEGEMLYDSAACHALLMWVWSRLTDQVQFLPVTEERIFDAANEMGKIYIEDPPLVQAANIRIKIARVAAAIAARTFSTDESFEVIVVRPEHVGAAVQLMNLLYGMPAFGYRERSREVLADRYAAEGKREEIRNYLLGRPLLAKHLRNAGKFRRQDLEELLSISKEEANGIINKLYECRMVRRVLGDIYVEPTLHTILREIKL